MLSRIDASAASLSERVDRFARSSEEQATIVSGVCGAVYSPRAGPQEAARMADTVNQDALALIALAGRLDGAVDVSRASPAITRAA